jgi:hypothetical protein
VSTIEWHGLMSRFLKTILAALAVLLAVNGAAPVRGDAILDSWNLVVGAYDLGSGGSATSSFTASSGWPSSPFHGSHSVGLGQSTAQAEYNFAWGVAFGQFLIQASHQAHQGGGDIVMALSNGEIKFTPTEDMIFSVDALYSYHLPVADTSVYFSVTLQDTQTGVYSYNYLESDEYIGMPIDNTFSDSGSGMMLAGHPYTLSYLMRPSASGSSGQSATGSGHVDFTFQVVPEPATAILLVCCTLAVLRRRLGGTAS